MNVIEKCRKKGRCYKFLKGKKIFTILIALIFMVLNQSVIVKATRPVTGTTYFDTLDGSITVVPTGQTSLTVNNYWGYDFTFNLGSASDGQNEMIIVEKDGSASVETVDALSDGTIPISSFECKSNDGAIFTLNSVTIVMNGANSTFNGGNVELVGYRNGSPVSGAILSLSVSDIDNSGSQVLFNVSSNSSFQGIDKFAIRGGAGYTVTGLLGIGAINATDFHFPNSSATVPSINTQPADQTVNVGDTANLSVSASGSGVLSYQWYSNSTNSNSGGTLISGATNSSYAAPTAAAGTTYYYCVVTNTDSAATGSQTATATTSAAKVVVNSLTNAAIPVMNTQPADQTVNVGDTANLSVSSSGSGVLSYQWYSNSTNSNSGGTLISGATNSSYAAPTAAAGTTYYYCVVTNTDSAATGSQTATTTTSAAKVVVNSLTNAATPVINTQPADQTVNVGDTANLSVAVSGGVVLSYQWYSNSTNSTSGGTAILGAVNASYTAPTAAAGTTYYYCVVTNTDSAATGSQTATATTNVAKVEVNSLTNAATPGINTQPADQTASVGDTANLSVAVSGGVVLSYQWYSNSTNSTSGGTAILGAVNASYTAPTAAAGTTYYYCVVTNTDSAATGSQTATATTNAAKVVVNSLTNAATPVINTHPADQTVNVGDTANLSVSASGSGVLSYQWYSNSTNSNSGGTLISGATSSSYAAPTGTAGTTYYYCVITNTDSAATGSQTATATTRAAKVVVNSLTNAAIPVMNTHPADQTVNVGDTANLSVSASGSGVLSYQWYSNSTNSNSGGTLISGATSSSYAAPTGTAGTTYYYCVITNTDSAATGSQTATATTRAAKVVVNSLTNAAIPVMNTHPADQTVNVGDTANLSVSASGSGVLSYQWYSNSTNSNSGGTLISGATNSSYAAPTGTAGTTYYYCIVTNTDTAATGSKTATATTSAAKVVVNSLTNAATPVINTQPADQTVNVGDTANLSVAASGGVVLSYQWYSNSTNSNNGGTAISGAVNASYTAPTGTAGTTYYYCVVTNTDSAATGSKTATATTIAAKVIVNSLTNAATPVINTQLADQTVSVGDTANLSVSASGGVVLSYQWYSNSTNSTSGGTAILGAVNASYTAPTAAAGTTYYYCVVTNTDSEATGNKTATTTTNVAKVEVNSLTNAATPGANPVGGAVLSGTQVILSSATAGADIYYTVDGSEPTTSSAIHYTAPITVTSAETIKAIAVKNGMANSSVMSESYTIATIPTITNQPVGQNAIVGQNVSFSVTATGTSPLSYQWRKNGTDISGANSSTLSLNNVQIADLGSYQVVVSNVAGSVTSSAVTLTVSPYIPTPDPTPSPSTEVITVPVTDGNSGDTVSQTVIDRTTAPDGTKKDDVTYTTSSAQQTVDKLKTEGKDTARIVVPDVKDEVSEAKVGVPKATIDVLASGGVNLEIDTENARIAVPKEAVKDIAADVKDDLYFRLVPVKAITQQQAIEERARQEEIVQQAAGNGSISVVARPMTIETNMKQTTTDITLPLKNVNIPTDPTEKQAFLNSLAVFIEHTDGTKELLKGKIVEYKTGVLGIEFTIHKYSTFTIIKMDNQNLVISPSTGDFDKNTSKQADISTTMTLNGNTLTSIVNGSITLVSGTDYEIKDNVVTIKKSYLAEQSVGTTTLTFNLNGGTTQTLVIAVKDTTIQSSTINPNTGDFDKNTSKQADISTTMTLNGNTLTSIVNGSKTLVSGTDYEVKDNVVTIKKSYLAQQNIGTTTLTFNFSEGATQALVITLKDTTPSSSGGSGGGGGGATSAPAPVKPAVERLSGQDRIETALAIAKASYSGKVSKVILAASDNYPDALAGNVLAYKEKAPILLVGRTDEEQEKVIAYMKSNMDFAGIVYILGGSGSVSKDMEEKINQAGFKNVNRIGGADRYETATKIADTVGVKEGTPIVLVSGENYPDALSISSIAAINGYPIFMVNKDEIPEVVKKEILTIKPSKVYIIGLQGAISAAVENQLVQTVDKTNIVRIGGADRFKTSLNVAKYFNLSGTKVCVASGNNFPDALAGSSYAANSNAPIILLDNSLTEEQKSYLENAKLKGVVIFGGTGAVSSEVEQELTQIFK